MHCAVDDSRRFSISKSLARFAARRAVRDEIVNTYVSDHGRESRIGVFEHKFGVGVLRPGGQRRLLVEREVTHQELLSAADEICRSGRGIVSDQRRCVGMID
jgi:hypothetical protein